MEDAPKPDGPLSVYQCTAYDNEEARFVVAETAEDAARSYEEQEGYDPADVDEPRPVLPGRGDDAANMDGLAVKPGRLGRHLGDVDPA